MLAPLTESEIAEIRRNYPDQLNYQSDDVYAPWDPMTYLDSGGDTLLHIAARRGDPRTVSLLLNAGMDPSVVGEMGYTPLHYAHQKKHDDVVSVLIDHGARTNIRNEFGKLPGDYGDADRS